MSDRRKYKVLQVYVPAEYEGEIATAKRLADERDRSLSRYVCLAIADYNRRVRNGEL